MRNFARIQTITLLLTVAALSGGASSCPNGPVVECNDPQITYPCPDGSCAISPGGCPAQDIDCPNEYPFRCDVNYCADGLNQCVPSEDGSPSPQWILAPEGLSNS